MRLDTYSISVFATLFPGTNMVFIRRPWGDARKSVRKTKIKCVHVTKYYTIRGVFCSLSQVFRLRPPIAYREEPGDEVGINISQVTS